MRLLLTMLALLFAGSALAQSYPNRCAWSSRLGQPFVAENRGGGVVAADYVAKSAADGYTILMTNDQLVVQAASASKLPYDPYKWRGVVRDARIKVEER